MKIIINNLNIYMNNHITYVNNTVVNPTESPCTAAIGVVITNVHHPLIAEQEARIRQSESKKTVVKVNGA